MKVPELLRTIGTDEFRHSVAEELSRNVNWLPLAELCQSGDRLKLTTIHVRGQHDYGDHLKARLRVEFVEQTPASDPDQSHAEPIAAWLGIRISKDDASVAVLDDDPEWSPRKAH